METLKNFLHPKRKENIRFVLSDSFVDEQGNPLEWEMRQIKAKEGMEISRDCEGAPEMETMARYIAEALVVPNLKSAEIVDAMAQMHNFIKSNNAQPIGPIVQAMVVGEDRQMHLYMMQQATQFIGQMEQDYHMDAVLRVKNCLYAHYTGPMPESQLASYKLQVHAFENEQKLTGTSYTIYVNQDEDDAVVDVFMETK